MDCKILIVTEIEHYAELIRTHLRNYGYANVTICRDSAYIEESLKQKPLLVLMDTQLTATDGFKLCHQIKRDPAIDAKVILMSGLAETYNPGKAMQVGADDYVVKTFDSLLLMAAIKKTLLQIEDQQETIK